MLAHRVSVEIPFCYGHRILGHGGKCKHLHGHNGKAVVVVASQNLNQLDMVIDFGEIKSKVKKWVDENWDHNFLLSQKDDIDAITKLSGRVPFVMRNGLQPTAEQQAHRLLGRTPDRHPPRLRRRLAAELTQEEIPRVAVVRAGVDQHAVHVEDRRAGGRRRHARSR